MTPFEAVRETIREKLYADQPLPPFLDEMVELFSKAHIYYRAYKQARIHQNAAKNPLQGDPAVYGAAVQLVGDYTSMGSYAVHVALITKCAEDLLQEYDQLSENYQRLNEAIDWQYPLYQPVEWKQQAKKNSFALLSPSLYLEWQVQIMGFIKQIFKVTRCAMDVFWQVFKLSMCLCDAYLLLNNDAQIRYEACTELIAEWDLYQKQLKENQKWLIEEIEKGGKLADSILNRLGVEKDSSFIADQLKQTTKELGEEAENLMNDLSDVAEETLDMAYIPGKITPLHIDLSKGKVAPPALPYGRFPPWTGQSVVMDSQIPSQSNFEFVEKLLIEKIEIPFITESIQGVSRLAKDVHQFYENQKNSSTPFSPFS